MNSLIPVKLAGKQKYPKIKFTKTATVKVKKTRGQTDAFSVSDGTAEVEVGFGRFFDVQGYPKYSKN